MKPLPDLDQGDYTFMQNVRYFAAVIWLYIKLGPSFIADCFKVKRNCTR